MGTSHPALPFPRIVSFLPFPSRPFGKGNEARGPCHVCPNEEEWKKDVPLGASEKSEGRDRKRDHAEVRPTVGTMFRERFHLRLGGQDGNGSRKKGAPGWRHALAVIRTPSTCVSRTDRHGSRSNHVPSIGSGNVAGEWVEHERTEAMHNTKDSECHRGRLEISRAPDLADRTFSHFSNRSRNESEHRERSIGRSVRTFSEDVEGRSSQLRGRIATPFDAIVRSTSQAFVLDGGAFLSLARGTIEGPPRAGFEQYEISLVRPGSIDESMDTRERACKGPRRSPKPHGRTFRPSPFPRILSQRARRIDTGSIAALAWAVWEHRGSVGLPRIVPNASSVVSRSMGSPRKNSKGSCFVPPTSTGSSSLSDETEDERRGKRANPPRPGRQASRRTTPERCGS